MDYNSYQVVSDLLKEIGYNEIGSYLDKHRDNDTFFKSCVYIILKKTPDEKKEYVDTILNVAGII